MKHFLVIVLIFFAISLLSGCSGKPSPEKLSISVKPNLALLQDNPQFVMYMNFKSMRQSVFWKENISDSILNAEKSFGSLLNVFKNATGVSISDGLDELYFSNAWLGENAIVLKGVFDKIKLDNYISKDSLITRNKRPDGIEIFTLKENELSFFFKDNFTLCASNFPKQIDQMIFVRDTSNSGVLKNSAVMNAIETVIYKEHLWMITTEKTFIRGIFANFVDSHKPGTFNSNTDTSTTKTDSLSIGDDIISNEFYKKINAFCISAKMKNDLKLIVQFECTDSKAADNFGKMINGMIALSRISSSLKKEKQNNSLDKILESLKIRAYDNSVQLYTEINKNNISSFRQNSFLKKPN